MTTFDPPNSLPSIYRRDPEAFVADWLGLKLYDKQVEILWDALYNQRLSIKSAPSVGKTYVCASLVLWFYYNFYPCKVLTTAPTMRQVRDLLWAEIRSLHSRARPLGGEILTTMIKHNGDPQWYAEGFATKKDENPQDVAARITGYHAPNLLAIIDDAHGVPDLVASTIDRALITGSNCKLMMIGNATVTSGIFCSAFKNPAFAKKTIQAYDCINVRERRMVIPGLVTHEWVKDKEEKWGTGHPLFDSLVLAQFPKESADTLISQSWVEAAQWRWKENKDKEIDAPEICSCDPGRSELGDPTAIIWRKGNRILRIYRRQGQSTMETVGILKIEQARGCIIVVDCIGIGTGIVDKLREDDIPVIAVNVGEGTDRRDRTGQVEFVNLRSYLWWRMREALDPNGDELLELPPDDYLLEDLCAPKWALTSAGKIQLESKDKIKARIGRSTDTGDAGAMSYIQITTEIVCVAGESPDILPSLSDRKQEPYQGSLLAPPWGGGLTRRWDGGR